MTMQEFIRENRAELDRVIRRAVPNIRTLDDARSEEHTSELQSR